MLENEIHRIESLLTDALSVEREAVPVSYTQNRAHETKYVIGYGGFCV